MSVIMITVAIPVFNGEKYIRESIQSVLDQTYPDFELIISNDGSTDATMEIVNSFQDPRIKVIDDGMHKGLATRLNEQIAMARGKYFARMDADDVMLPLRLECQMSFVMEHPETDVLGSSVVVIDENGKKIGYRGAFDRDISYIPNGTLFSLVNTFMHPTVFGKTEWFREYYYNPACEGCEDMDLWIRSIKKSTFYAISTPLLLYRDPQRINLDLYLFRREQERYVLKINRERLSVFQYYIRIMKSLLKSYSVRLLVSLGQEKWVLKARNIRME